MIVSATLAAVIAMLGPSPEAKAAYDRAVAAWEAKDWLVAADAFEHAHELDPRPELLWSQAQALRFGGDCKRAITAYESFIAMDPPDVDEETARGNIERCEAEIEPEPAVEPPPPVVAPPKPAPAQPDRAPPPREWYADPTGVSLFVGGLAVAGVGGGLTGSAHAMKDDAPDAASEQTYRSDIAAAQRRNAAGIACLAVGGALMAGSVIRFVILGRRAKRAVAGLELRF
jgi:tetratricopeptide (TPR) repeat protein